MKITDEQVQTYGTAYDATYLVDHRNKSAQELAAVETESIRAGLEAVLPTYGPSWAEVEAWLKARRDLYDNPRGRVQWRALDAALDDLREHMHTGIPLDQPVQGPHPEEA